MSLGYLNWSMMKNVSFVMRVSALEGENLCPVCVRDGLFDLHISTDGSNQVSF